MPRKLKALEKCECCAKMYRHVKKYKGRCEEFIGKKYCSNCFRKIPRNPFFVEVKDRPSAKLTKFSMSQAEKLFIHKKYIKQGYSSAKAWHKVNIISFQMRCAKGRKAKAFKKQKMDERLSKDKSLTFKKSFDTLK